MSAEASPLVIGGTGGSGTRLIKRLADSAGRFMGTDLNASDDAWDFVRFDWRWGPTYIAKGASPEMVAEFRRAVARHCAPIEGTHARWGWKHPHSYLLLPFLHEQFPSLRFVHVVRDGRDMAFSDNQNQLRHYGRVAIGEREEAEPLRSIAFWAWANLRAADFGEQALGDRYLRFRFEDLFVDPQAARRLFAFAGGEGALPELPAASNSIGRWRREDPTLASELTRAGRTALRRFGYIP